MTDEKQKILMSPEVCAWADDEHESYKIEVTLPGVEKDTIKLRIHEDSFFIKGETDDVIYVGSYAICCPIKAEETKATYKNGLLKVEVPFLDPMENAVEVKIE